MNDERRTVNDLTQASPADDVQNRVLESQVMAVLGTVYDPEIPVNIRELGLIYGVEVQPGGKVHVRMTLTVPGCPVADSLPAEVKSRIEAIDRVSEAEVEVVWDPSWTPERMSEAARLELGLA